MSNKWTNFLGLTANEQAGEEIADAVEAVPVEPVIEEPTEVQAEEQTAEEVTPEQTEAPAFSTDDWPDDHKQLWENSGPNGRALIEAKYRDLESGYTKKFQESAEAIKGYEAVQTALAPYEHVIKQFGLTPDQAINELANSFNRTQQFVAALQNPDTAQDALNQLLTNIPNRNEILTNLAKANGVSIDPYDQQAPESSPELLDRLNKVEQQITGVAQNMQNSSITQTTNHVNEFREAKNADGNLLHPHYDKVSPVLPHFIALEQQKGNSDPLPAAYESAIWSDEELRGNFVSEQKKVQDTQADERRKAALKNSVSTEPVSMPETRPVNGQSGDQRIKGRTGWTKALNDTAKNLA